MCFILHLLSVSDPADCFNTQTEEASLPVLGSQLTDLGRLQQQLLLQLVGGQRILQELDLYSGRVVQHLVEDTALNRGHTERRDQQLGVSLPWLRPR